MSNTEQSYQVQSHVKKGRVEHVNDGVTSSGDGVTKILEPDSFTIQLSTQQRLMLFWLQISGEIMQSPTKT